MREAARRLLSHAWPIRKARVQGAHGPLDLVWENGRLVVNSANANQSWGSLQTVWERMLAVQGIGERTVGRALILGLGGGGLVRLLRTLHPDCRITAVDDDPVMIAIAAEHFGIAPDALTAIVNEDAFDHIGGLDARFDLVLVDLFVDDRVPSGLIQAGTLNALARVLAPGGELMINTMLDGPMAEALADFAVNAGLEVTWATPLPTNRVLLAWRPAPSAMPPSPSDR